jgi:hypothetical protein
MAKKETKATALIVAADKPRAIFLKLRPLNTNIAIRPKITTRELNFTKYARAKTNPVIEDNRITLGTVFCLAAVADSNSERIRRSPWSHSGEADFRPPQNPTYRELPRTKIEARAAFERRHNKNTAVRKRTR